MGLRYDLIKEFTNESKKITAILKKYEPFFYERGNSTFVDMRESETGEYVRVEDLKDCHCDSFVNGDLCVWNERTKCIGGPCRKRDRVVELDAKHREAGICSACFGKGTNPNWPTAKCVICGGSGKQPRIV